MLTPWIMETGRKTSYPFHNPQGVKSSHDDSLQSQLQSIRTSPSPTIDVLCFKPRSAPGPLVISASPFVGDLHFASSSSLLLELLAAADKAGLSRMSLGCWPIPPIKEVRCPCILHVAALLGGCLLPPSSIVEAVKMTCC